MLNVPTVELWRNTFTIIRGEPNRADAKIEAFEYKFTTNCTRSEKKKLFIVTFDNCICKKLIKLFVI